MNNKKIEIELLYKKIELKKIEIEHFRAQIFSLKETLFNEDWMQIGWSELELWLKENRKENSTRKNPVVVKEFSNTVGYGYEKNCKLNDFGQLLIGGYYYCDGYKRGEPVYVKKDFQSWDEYFSQP